MDKPLILAPVSSPLMAEAVLDAGADIIYGGLKGWSLRPDMFEMDREALYRAISMAKGRNRQFFLPFNCFYRSGEIPKVLQIIDEFEKFGVDGVILSQTGLVREVRKLHPYLKIQISVQASASSTVDIDYFKALGASGIVLPRNCADLDIENIRALAGRGIDLEIFAIGDDSTNYDGRCFLSAYLFQKKVPDPFGRESMVLGNANRCGYCFLACKRPCTAGGRTDTWLKRRDLTVYRQIPELIKAGVKIFKIQGREFPIPLVKKLVSTFRSLLDSAGNEENFNIHCQKLEDLLALKRRISANHLWLLAKSSSPFWKKIRPVIEGPWDNLTALLWNMRPKGEDR